MLSSEKDLCSLPSLKSNRIPLSLGFYCRTFPDYETQKGLKVPRETFLEREMPWPRIFWVNVALLARSISPVSILRCSLSSLIHSKFVSHIGIDGHKFWS